MYHCSPAYIWSMDQMKGLKNNFVRNWLNDHCGFGGSVVSKMSSFRFGSAKCMTYLSWG